MEYTNLHQLIKLSTKRPIYNDIYIYYYIYSMYDVYINTPHFPYILQKFPEFPGGASGELVSDEAVE